MITKNGAFLTTNINEEFAPSPCLNCISEDDINKQGSIAATFSNFVEATGFEQYLSDLLEIQKLRSIVPQKHIYLGLLAEVFRITYTKEFLPHNSYPIVSIFSYTLN